MPLNRPTLLLLSAPILLVLALLTACNLTTRTAEDFRSADGRIEIEFWHAMAGDHAGALNRMIDEFNAAQDQYRVRGVYQGHYDSLNQKLIASTYAGRPPAISQMYGAWTRRFLRAGVLQPVDHFIQQDQQFRENDLPDLIESYFSDNQFLLRLDENGYHIDAESGVATLATIPFNKSIYMLFVNETLLREKGLSAPRSWAELRATAIALTDTSIPRSGFGTRPNIEAFTPLYFSTGRNMMDDTHTTFTFDQPEGRSAIEFLHQLTVGEEKAGYVDPAFLNSSFGSGRIAMYIGSSAAFPFNDAAVGTRFIWRAYGIPGPTEDVEPLVLCQGTNIGIFRRGFSVGSDLPQEVQQGAWEFAKFVSRPDQNAAWARQTGYMPIRRATIAEPEMAEYLAANPNFANAVALLDRLASEPTPTYWDTIRQILNTEVDNVLSAGKPPLRALDDALARSRRIQATADGRTTNQRS
jgi:multiple sugar transport system substrate-binding protein